ncbi:hypothetical protein NPIL_16631 [Nephila pilipes]|uniref:Uncharacterized protein n=1 Tax=Nephila pilipes TaxID=299642 RepID=A0A8X6TX88_NEPPI|nr:hypothetical protein NPIL_16631 [Nephila pilipes]
MSTRLFNKQPLTSSKSLKPKQLVVIKFLVVEVCLPTVEPSAQQASNLSACYKSIGIPSGQPPGSILQSRRRGYLRTFPAREISAGVFQQEDDLKANGNQKTPGDLLKNVHPAEIGGRRDFFSVNF